MNWTSEFDEFQCDFGTPSVFSLTHEGEIQLDVKRTRDFYKHNEHWILKRRSPNQKNEIQHVIAIDNRTHIPQYLLISTQDSCDHPHFELIECTSYEQSQDVLLHYKERAFTFHEERKREN